MGQQELALLVLLLTCFTLSSSLEEILSTSSTPQLKDSKLAFDEFKGAYNKLYPSEAEEQRANEAYDVNIAKIEAHNQLYTQGKVSYFLGLNKFVDVRLSRILQNLAGVVFDAEELKLANGNVAPATGRFLSLPGYVDYSANGVVTPVKEQGACASSWAVAATGTVESIYALKTGTLLDLSEQQLVDCSDNDGCDGGSVLKALNYMTVANGLVTEEEYPYQDQEDICDTVKLTPEKLKIKLKGTGSVIIPGGAVDAMIYAIANVGPITVTIHAVSSFFLYKGGIFNESNCNPEMPNYALLVVGYGFDDQTKVFYWKARGNLGSTWGEDGYIRILRGGNICGVENVGVYADLDPSELPTSNLTASPILGVVSSDFEMQPTSDPELSVNSEFYISALASVVQQFSITQDRYSKARGIHDDLQAKYNKKYRVVIGTSYSFSGEMGIPNYLVLKQKNTSPAVFITIVQTPDCTNECGRVPGFFLDTVNPGDFIINSVNGNMGNAEKQTILDVSTLAMMYLTNTTLIAKYISRNLQNLIGSYMDTVVGTDYDNFFWYRIPRYMLLKKNNLWVEVYMPDCTIPRTGLRSSVQFQLSQNIQTFPKSWWTYDENATYASMCGKNAPLYDGRYPVCDPDDTQHHCCSSSGYCGDGPRYCDSIGSIDYTSNRDRVTKDAVPPTRLVQWFTMADKLNDGQPTCGYKAPRINGNLVAICNPDNDSAFCCSSAGVCGNTTAHCDCEKCVNFRITPFYNYPELSR